MPPRARIYVVVPARNEAPRIGEVVTSMPPLVDRIIVVDDGSRDGTGDAARAPGEPRTVVLRHEETRGVGAAIVTGYRAALADVGDPRDAFVVMAGDGQMSPRDLPAVAGPVVRGEVGYVKGNRFGVRDAATPMPLARRAAGEFLSYATSHVTGLSITDSQCGYTALSRAACERLDLDALWPRYGYPNDLLAQLAERNIAVREVLVEPIYRGEPSGIRPWHVARIAWLLSRARLRLLRSARVR